MPRGHVVLATLQTPFASFGRKNTHGGTYETALNSALLKIVSVASCFSSQVLFDIVI